MKTWIRLQRPGSVILVAALGVALAASPLAAAQEERDRKDRPERGIAIYTDYSEVVVPIGETVRMDLTVENKGRTDENISLKFTALPRGWKTSLRGGSFTVSGVSVPDGKTRTLSLTAEPEKNVPPGTYAFGLEGTTADGKLTAAHTITVTTRERSRLGTDDLVVTTNYPVLRGPSDSKFEFSLDVANKSDSDRNVDLASQAPPKWEVNFKPGYESKQITSLRIKGGQSQTVAVEVTPPKDATAGEYPVQVRFSAGESKVEGRLVVALTGIYKLDAITRTGLLSAEAVTGKPTTVSLLVRNTGSAPNRNITISAFKPENWKVEFKPEKIDVIEPGAMKQVEATITPAATALVGDYSVGLSADGEKANKTVEMRVTVTAPTAWGWIGVGIIAVVIAGMGGLFAWLGRR